MAACQTENDVPLGKLRDWVVTETNGVFQVLPQGYTFEWSGLAFEEKKSVGTSMMAFVFGLIIVFLVLAAQYESWTLPGSVMMAVPFGVLGALTANWLRGLENDV